MSDKRPFACLVMAAGKGTRMQSTSAKVLAEADGAPLLSHVLDAVEPLEPARRVVVVGYDRDNVKARFADRALEFVVQEEQLGTGHAVSMGAPLLADFDGDVLILSGDMPLVRTDTLDRLLRHHRANDAAFTLTTAKPDDPVGLGRIVRDADGNVERIVEEKDIDSDDVRAIREINLGVYAADAKRLFDALGKVKNDNAQSEYYLPDVVAILLAEGARVEAWCGADPEEGLGVNTRDQLAIAESALTRRRGR